MEILLETYRGALGLTPSDRLLAAALEARGVRASPRPWDSIDPGAGRDPMVCVRSPWDYQVERNTPR